MREGNNRSSRLSYLNFDQVERKKMQMEKGEDKEVGKERRWGKERGAR